LNTEISGYLCAPAAFGLQYPYLRSLDITQSRSEYRIEGKNLCPRRQSKVSFFSQNIFLPVLNELIRVMKFNEENVKSKLTTKHTCIHTVFPGL